MSSNQSFSTNGGTNDFLESNSLVAKFAFLLLVLFLFVILLKVGVSFITWLVQPNGSPTLISGMIDATQQQIFLQDPSGSSGTVTTILRSNNAVDGLEFTWSVWINVTNLQYLEGKFRHIFYKGNSNYAPNGMNYPNNAPGLYIAPFTNSLVVVMNTFNDITQEVIIPDIPLNLWLNIIIRCQGQTLDVFVNGTIAKSIHLKGIPKQNYGDVYVAANGGFQGNISNLRYWNYALGTREIQKVAYTGANTKPTSSSLDSYYNSDYLSLRWFFRGSGDAYNPPAEKISASKSS
jgi:hypothetical protein